MVFSDRCARYVAPWMVLSIAIKYVSGTQVNLFETVGNTPLINGMVGGKTYVEDDVERAICGDNPHISYART